MMRSSLAVFSFASLSSGALMNCAGGTRAAGLERGHADDAALPAAGGGIADLAGAAGTQATGPWLTTLERSELGLSFALSVCPVWARNAPAVGGGRCLPLARQAGWSGICINLNPERSRTGLSARARAGGISGPVLAAPFRSRGQPAIGELDLEMRGLPRLLGRGQQPVRPTNHRKTALQRFLIAQRLPHPVQPQQRIAALRNRPPARQIKPLIELMQPVALRDDRPPRGRHHPRQRGSQPLLQGCADGPADALPGAGSHRSSRVSSRFSSMPLCDP